MRFRKMLIALSLLAAASVAAAQTHEALAAGGWEFGGSLKFSHAPNYAIFAEDVSDYDRGEYNRVTDVSLSVGKFLADGFSIAVRPTALLTSNRRVNSSYQESIRRSLFLGVGVEPSWYIPLGRRWMLGLGGEAGFGIWPGLTEIDDGVTETDKSLSIQLWLEPKARTYFLVSDILAPYVEIGYRLALRRLVRTVSGDPYTSDANLFEEIRGRFAITLGLKYFLPQSARFAETQKTPYNDVLDIMVDD